MPTDDEQTQPEPVEQARPVKPSARRTSPVPPALRPFGGPPLQIDRHRLKVVLGASLVAAGGLWALWMVTH